MRSLIKTFFLWELVQGLMVTGKALWHADRVAEEFLHEHAKAGE